MTSGSDRVKRYRRRQKLRGMARIITYLDPETKSQLDQVVKQKGTTAEAIKYLLEFEHQRQNCA